MLPRKWRKEASENFLSVRKRFLGPKNLHCKHFKNLAPLAQCIWPGFHHEKAYETKAEDETEEVEEGSI